MKIFKLWPCIQFSRNESRQRLQGAETVSDVVELLLRLEQTHNALCWYNLQQLWHQISLTSSSGGLNALRPGLCVNCKSQEKDGGKKRSTLGHFFPLSNVYVNGLALGAMEWGLQRSVSLATNISKSHQILTPSHTHAHTHKYIYIWTLSPPPPLQRPNKRLGKKMAALWPPALPPCIQPREVTEDSLSPPSSTLTLLLWRASQSFSINHFWGRVEATGKHRQMHWKECSS